MKNSIFNFELVKSAIDEAFKIDVSKIDFDEVDSYGLKVHYKNSALPIANFEARNKKARYIITVDFLHKSNRCKLEISAQENEATIQDPNFENVMHYRSGRKTFRFDKDSTDKILNKVKTFIKNF